MDRIIAGLALLALIICGFAVAGEAVWLIWDYTLFGAKVLGTTLCAAAVAWGVFLVAEVA